MLTLDLTGLNAVRFKATVSGDWVVGDEIEPYETTKMVQIATATGPNALHVVLNDGRTQDITISGFDDGGTSPQVAITESKNGQATRRETTNPQ